MKRYAEQKARDYVRRVANCHNIRQPVQIVNEEGGKNTIGFTGESYHYETCGGTRIRYPSAYSRKGWGNMVYIPSSRQLECGADFFCFLIRWYS